MTLIEPLTLVEIDPESEHDACVAGIVIALAAALQEEARS